MEGSLFWHIVAQECWQAQNAAFLSSSTVQQDYHKEKKVAIDGWGRLMEAITLNNCCVGMGYIALLFDD